ncbi:MAG: hypothetical protein HOJ22_01145 [Chloroflexi bacterium]|jgi:hypothetical protein|nr:hypothetical protein [Chloroflexota bacterium]MBT5626873.1 hypothetical protein [Chloroflexota bacterium]
MPKNTRKNRRSAKPNVFAQSQRPEDDGSVGDAGVSSADSGSAPQPRARVQRSTQRASVRSEIYTRSLSAELKKMGTLSGVVVVALIVLTFAL